VHDSYWTTRYPHALLDLWLSKTAKGKLLAKGLDGWPNGRSMKAGHMQPYPLLTILVGTSCWVARSESEMDNARLVLRGSQSWLSDCLVCIGSGDSDRSGSARISRVVDFGEQL
jgi:hypothetical protein